MLQQCRHQTLHSHISSMLQGHVPYFRAISSPHKHIKWRVSITVATAACQQQL
jgi:hypothetical protein